MAKRSEMTGEFRGHDIHCIIHCVNGTGSSATDYIPSNFGESDGNHDSDDRSNEELLGQQEYAQRDPCVVPPGSHDSTKFR